MCIHQCIRLYTVLCIHISMQESINQIIEEVLTDEFDQEIAQTRLRRISKEFAKFGGVRE